MLLLSACERSSYSEAEARLRNHFGISTSASIDSEPSPILKMLPLGTPEDLIYDYLNRSGIGKDALSSFYPANANAEIVCRVEYDADSPGIVKESFVLLFILDEQRRLKRVDIQRGLTGP